MKYPVHHRPLQLLLLAGCCQPLSVPAVDAPDSLLGCAVIADDAERLACYDALALEARVPEDTGSRMETTPAEDVSAVEERIRQTELASHNWFALTPYRPNYFLPLTLDSSPNSGAFEGFRGDNGIDHAEAKFQISLEFDVWRNMLNSHSDLYFGYTQVAWWQLYNRDASSPFRETNYEPELGVILRPDLNILGLNSRQMRFGIVHQSNGRSEPRSRSWNRLYGILMLDRGNFASALRFWYRLPEDEDEDDNPDITDYYGNFELYGFYKWRDQTFGMMLRNNLDREDNRGAIQLDWSYPLNDRLKFYVQYFNGYGESLIDYNTSTNRLGFGLMLTDWL